MNYNNWGDKVPPGSSSHEESFPMDKFEFIPILKLYSYINIIMFDFLSAEINIENSLLFATVVIGLFIIYVKYRQHTSEYMIHYHPVDVTIEHHILRIPIEDRIDLAIEDKHNVHNCCLKRNAITIIQKLKNSDKHQYSIESTINKIRDLIELSPDTDLEKLDAAYQALDSIEQINAFYHHANIHELEILRLVWERINHPINQKKMTCLQENLIEQLADCKNDYSSVHCCEGRIMRILQTLENCDSENFVNLRPMWAYKEEIGNKISQYRDKLIHIISQKCHELEKKNNLTQKNHQMLNQFKNFIELEKKINLTSNDKKILDIFNKCLIKNLTKRFEIDYISSGLLKKSEVDDLTKVYFESLYDY